MASVNGVDSSITLVASINSLIFISPFDTTYISTPMESIEEINLRIKAKFLMDRMFYPVDTKIEDVILDLKDPKTESP